MLPISSHNKALGMAMVRKYQVISIDILGWGLNVAFTTVTVGVEYEQKFLHADSNARFLLFLSEMLRGILSIQV